MKLEPKYLEKIDPLLETELREARGDEKLLVVMLLNDNSPEKEDNQFEPELHPSQFPDRKSYRQALINLQEKRVRNAIGDTLKELENLSLITKGGIISRTVVVEGTARQILASLALEAVNHVTLDQPIALHHIAQNIAHIIEEGINNLDPKTEQFILKAAAQYFQTYYKRYGKLRVLGMKQLLPLDFIYTAVQFLDSSEISNFISSQDLEKVYRENRGFQSRKSEKQSGIQVAKQSQYLMVLGAPGSGKSTFLRRMGLEALKGKEGNFGHESIPVFIELKRFKPSEINIEDCITNEFKTCGFPQPEELIEKLLKQGKLLILLDGLDEVPTKHLNPAIDQIQEFVEKYQQNRFITSCRTAAYHQNFRKFKNVEIADFDETQIGEFIYNWFQSDEDKESGTADIVWQKLQDNSGMKELAKTPLLLTFLCLVYDRSQSFPTNRSTLYQKALRILLEEWAAEKRIQREEIAAGLNTDLEEILLSEIAYQGFEADKLFFSRQELIDQITDFIDNNLNAPKHLAGKDILHAIEVQQGILVERARDAYSFSHLTLQEYLTAKYIVDNRLAGKMVSQHLTDERWHEVFLLVAGLMGGGADELLLLMEKEAQKFINSPKLKGILEWADWVTDGSESDMKPVGKRSIANAQAYTYTKANADTKANTITIAYVIANPKANNIKNAYAYAIATAIYNNITNNIAYAHEIEKLKIFNKVNFTLLIGQIKEMEAQIHNPHLPQQAHKKFDEELRQINLNAWNLNRECINLSKQERIDWENYLSANHLIIQCKEAAVRVSPKTWAEIEARMLRVVGD